MVSSLSTPSGYCCTEFDVVKASPGYEKEGKTRTGVLFD